MEYNKATNTCPEPAGILLIIGGKEDKGDELNKKQEEEKNAKKVAKKIISCFKTNKYIE